MAAAFIRRTWKGLLQLILRRERRLSPSTLHLFGSRGITSEAEIRRRAAKAQKAVDPRAGDAFRNYWCVGQRQFLEPRLPAHPQYELLSSSHAVLDVGCGMGQELRQLVLDGAGTERCLGVDVSRAFLVAGLELFGDSETWGGRFLCLDFLEGWGAHPGAVPEALEALAFDAIVAQNVLHTLGSRDEVSAFAERVRQLLRPGGVFAGYTPPYRPCPYNWNQLEETLTRAGLVDVRIEPVQGQSAGGGAEGALKGAVEKGRQQAPEDRSAWFTGFAPGTASL